MPNSLDTGTQLGPYEIKKPLGAGGMGEVYLASDARLGREVAIKVLPSEFATDAERLARFDQEARAAAALNHPHIAVVHDIGEEGGTYFMVQERLEGQTLRDLLEAGRPALGKALDLCTEIAEALTAAHAAGIVHRDLKPENVFVSKDGHAKVLDFGLAKLMELSPIASPGGVTKSPTMVGTVAGQVMGTAGYMAPEQIEGGEIDHRADIFAFGIVLYEMTTGQQPFKGRNVVDTLSLITNESPPELVEVDDSLPRALQRILHKALAKDPAERYQSIADAVVDLRALAADVEADRAVTVAEAGRPAAAGGVPLWMAAAGMAATLLLGAVVAPWLLPGGDAPPTNEWVFAHMLADGRTQPVCCGRHVGIAPDDSYFVHASLVDGERQLFLRRRGQNEAVPIPGGYGTNPEVSPDGEWIAFWGGRGDTAGVYKVAVAGGDPFQLTTGDGWRASWGDDGWLYYESDDREIGRVPAVGGATESVTVTGFDEGAEVHVVSWMPGGKVLVGVSGAADVNGFGFVDWATGAYTEIAAEGVDPRWSSSGHVLFTRGATLYALPFDASAGVATGPAVPVLQGLRVDGGRNAQFDVSGLGTLVWTPGDASSAGFNRPVRLVAMGEDGSTDTLFERMEGYYDPRLSPDGRRIAVSVGDQDSEDIWIAELDQGVLSRLTVGGGAYPIWSPDGRWIYYAATTQQGSLGIRRIATDFGSDPEELHDLAGAWPTSISPDGRTLLLDLRTDAGMDVASLDLEALDEPVTVVGRAEFREAGGVFSPGGAYLAYQSNESGEVQVYLREVDGTRRWLVTPDRGYIPAWSSDGRRLYYTDRSGLYYVEIKVDPEVVIGPPVLVGALGPMRGPEDVLADGRVLMRDPQPMDDESVTALDRLNIALNWFEELNRLAPAER